MQQHWDETSDDNYSHSQLTGNLLAAVIRVQKGLGPGLLEDVHKASLTHALRQYGLRVAR